MEQPVSLNVFTVQGTRLNLQPGTRSNLQAAPSTANISISIFIHWKTCKNSTYSVR